MIALIIEFLQMHPVASIILIALGLYWFLRLFRPDGNADDEGIAFTDDDWDDLNLK